jgi:5-methylcytosine-specific restriction endonuclease McrA
MKYRRRKNTGARKISHYLWFELLKSFDFKCAYCERETSQLTPDHFIPLSAGGKTEIENYVPACSSCNSKKGSVDPKKFLTAEQYKIITSKMITSDIFSKNMKGSL